jgi:exodeoxyribonuclease VII large subunit
MESVLERGFLRLRHAGRLLSPENRLSQAFLRLTLAEERLTRAMSERYSQVGQAVAALESRLRLCAPKEKLLRQEARLESLQGRLSRLLRAFPQRFAEKLAHQSELLQSHSPLATLGRGYAIVRNPSNGQVIGDSRQINLADEMDILLHHGQLQARVTAVRHDPDSPDHAAQEKSG